MNEYLAPFVDACPQVEHSTAPSAVIQVNECGLSCHEGCDEDV